MTQTGFAGEPSSRGMCQCPQKNEGGELVMQIDLMFKEGLAFLVSIVDPTAHMLVDHLDSKSAESIWPKLQRHIRFYEKGQDRDERSRARSGGAEGEDRVRNFQANVPRPVKGRASS